MEKMTNFVNMVDLEEIIKKKEKVRKCIKELKELGIVIIDYDVFSLIPSVIDDEIINLYEEISKMSYNELIRHVEKQKDLQNKEIKDDFLFTQPKMTNAKKPYNCEGPRVKRKEVNLENIGHENYVDGETLNIVDIINNSKIAPIDISSSPRKYLCLRVHKWRKNECKFWEEKIKLEPGLMRYTSYENPIGKFSGAITNNPITDNLKESIRSTKHLIHDLNLEETISKEQTKSNNHEMNNESNSKFEGAIIGNPKDGFPGFITINPITNNLEEYKKSAKHLIHNLKHENFDFNKLYNDRISILNSLKKDIDLDRIIPICDNIYKHKINNEYIYIEECANGDMIVFNKNANIEDIKCMIVEKDINCDIINYLNLCVYYMYSTK